MLAGMTGPVAIHIRVLRYLRGLLLRLPVYLLIYVLSIGPMYWQWYEARYMHGSTWVLFLYEPLHQACRIQFIADFVDWYIDLWIL